MTPPEAFWNPPTLPGDRIDLRPLTEADAHGPYGEWMNDKTATRFTEGRFAKHTPESLLGYIQAMAAAPDQLLLGMIDRETQRHIGNIKLGFIEWRHHFGDISILLGDRNFWGRGLGAEAIRILGNFSLDTLKMHKLTANCYDINTGGIKAFERAGFTVECSRPRHFLHDGKFVALVHLARFNPDFNLDAP